MDDSEKEKKEILIKDKNENNIKEKSELQNEPKSYMNCHCCQISIGLLLTYTYIFISIFLNLNNRIIYHKYNFRFNFTLLFIQQLFSLITFFILSFKSKTFKDKTGEISFKDFLKFKYYYLSFCIMYVTLRKLVLVMIFFLDFFVFKKPIKLLTIFSVFLNSIWTTLVSMDDFTSDYLGYIVVIINNTLTIIYVKFGENFKKKTGVTNLKLLVYNSYLSQPILIAAIFIRGEYKKVFLYFNNENIIDKNYYYGFLFYLFISCSLCIILNSSFLLSNEKNSSLFTQLLSNSKDILFAFLSYFILKNNKLTIRIIIGLIISTAGALLISMKSLSENLKFEKKEEEEEDKELEDKEQV